jgi:hypothetical protein
MDMDKRFINHFKANKRGQSFVELALITLILALMLAGVVEFGYLLNSYLKLLDGAREGARFSSSSVAFDPATRMSAESFYENTVIEVMRVISPIVLNGNRGDDIVISVFSVSGSNVERWPLGYSTGWSLCSNSTDSVIGLNAGDWSSCSSRASQFTSQDIADRMDASAPGSGIVLVEIYYNYPQILKLPVFSQIIPDPIPVYTYSVMPNSAAEPTATPSH